MKLALKIAKLRAWQARLSGHRTPAQIRANNAKSKRYYDRKSAGLCVSCCVPVKDSTLCDDCAYDRKLGKYSSKD